MFFYGAAASYAGVNANPGCLRLSDYSGTVDELLAAITRHANRSNGGYLALVALE